MGAPLTASGVGFTPELREAIREERAGALERAVAAARRAGAEALLVTGDLWDAGAASLSEIRRQLDALAAFGRPVFVAPGPLDAPARLPCADAAFREAVGLGEWPANVRLFTESGWTAAPFPGRDDVVVIGRADDGAPLPDPRGAPAPISILLASVPGGEPRVPSGWTWGGFGGAPAPQEVRDGSVVRGAVSGSPVPESFEDGDRAFLLVRLTRGAPPGVVRVSSSGIRFLDVAVDTEGREGAGVLEEAARSLDAAGAGARDAVRLTLTGTPSLAARLALSGLRARVLHLSIRDRMERPSPGEAQGTAEGRFADEMRARIVAAADPRAARTAALARELGRAALAGRPLVPPGREDA